jgi:hypothetical protein
VPDLIARDASAFFHQHGSSPCIGTLAGAQGAWLIDDRGSAGDRIYKVRAQRQFRGAMAIERPDRSVGASLANQLQPRNRRPIKKLCHLREPPPISDLPPSERSKS